MMVYIGISSLAGGSVRNARRSDFERSSMGSTLWESDG